DGDARRRGNDPELVDLVVRQPGEAVGAQLDLAVVEEHVAGGTGRSLHRVALEVAQRADDDREEHDGGGGPEDAGQDRGPGRGLAGGGGEHPALERGRGGGGRQRHRQRRGRLLVLADEGLEGLRPPQLLREAGQILPVQRPQRVERSQVLVVLRVQWASPDRTGRACLNLFIPSLMRVFTVPRGSPRRWAICVWLRPSK